MTRHRAVILLLGVWMATHFMAKAQPALYDSLPEPPIRPVASIFMAEVGHTSALDTYLSPVTYGGTSLGLYYSATQATAFSPRRWVRQLSFGADYTHPSNPVGNNHEHVLMAEAGWSMMHRWSGVATPPLQLMLGGNTRLRGGALYNPSNSNNVVSVKAHWSLGLAAMAVYNTHLGRLPVTLAYQAVLPVAGVCFSPQYDESFYEIYVGNHSHLVHFAWWGNRFDMDNLITADLHLGNTILRLGYRNRIERSWIQHLNTHLTTHALVVGIGGDFTAIGRQSTPPATPVISAMY